jgi:hypothetical protein
MMADFFFGSASTMDVSGYGPARETSKNIEEDTAVADTAVEMVWCRLKASSSYLLLEVPLAQV